MIDNNGREIELKFRVDDEQAKELLAILGEEDLYIGDSKDIFWELPYSNTAFLRYRASCNQYQIKIEDKGNVFDRIEIDMPNLIVVDTPLLKITKKAWVWRLPEEIEYSLYYVNELNSWFFEIEGKNIKAVEGCMPKINMRLTSPLDKTLTESLFTLAKKELLCGSKSALQG